MNKINQARLALVAGVSSLGGAAMAAVPADVTSALGTIQADALTVGGLPMVPVRLLALRS